MTREDSDHGPGEGPNWSRVNQWLLWLGLAAAVIWLVVQHGAHLLEVSPFLLLLACPLMHLFGHGGHGGHGAHRSEGSAEQDRATPPSSRSADAPSRRDPPPDGHSH
jgi:hypothetical protein